MRWLCAKSQARLAAELEARQLEVRLLRLEAAQRREDAFSDAGEATLAQAAAAAGARHGAAVARLAGVQAAGEAAQQRVAGLQQARFLGLSVV